MSSGPSGVLESLQICTLFLVREQGVQDRKGAVRMPETIHI
jgi:hypothetical protein